jgi:hypothetical protein
MDFIQPRPGLRKQGYLWVVLATDRHPQIWLWMFNKYWLAKFACGELGLEAEGKSRESAAEKLVEAYLKAVSPD